MLHGNSLLVWMIIFHCVDINELMHAGCVSIRCRRKEFTIVSLLPMLEMKLVEDLGSFFSRAEGLAPGVDELKIAHILNSIV